MNRNWGSVVFLISGLIFLAGALALFGASSYLLYTISRLGPIIELQSGASEITQLYNFYGRLIAVFFAPVMIILSALISVFVGIKLLRAAGAVTQHVIPTQDYELLSNAISSANADAVSEYIRLSSLSGLTGTFTKIGLTGLPLATIFLTVFLSVLGLVVPGFFDLAKLTLGAFIGSYVQKQRNESS
jgi:hypothetical protein